MSNHLIIGLGGTGGKLIRELRKRVYEEFRSNDPGHGVNLDYVYVDSSPADLNDRTGWKVLGKSVHLGEAQKVMLARALAQEPRFLLLDEPTSNLDPKNQHEVLRIVRDIAQTHNICVIIIIHDLNLAVRYCDKFLFLRNAKVYAYGGKETMTPDVIREVYGMNAEVIHHGDIPIIVPYPSETVPDV